MFGMSVTEVAIILVLALVLLGPDELPKVAKAVGKGLRELRKTTDDLRSTFEQEMVRLDEDRPAGPALVPPAHETVAAPLDQPTPAGPSLAQDPGAARAAARIAAVRRMQGGTAPVVAEAGAPSAAEPEASSAPPVATPLHADAAPSSAWEQMGEPPAAPAARTPAEAIPLEKKSEPAA